MGIFGKLFSSSGTETVTYTSEREAFFAVVFACICIDGDVSDEELNNLVTYCSNNAFLNPLPTVESYRKMVGLKNKLGLEAMVTAALPRISADRKPTLFAVAVDFMLADGIVGPKEETLLEDLQKGLEIEESQATKIIEVLLIKNKA